MKTLKKYFPYIRIFCYLLFFIVAYLMPVNYEQNKSICLVYNQFHVLCPTCGVTRAFSLMLRFQFSRAFTFNPLFTCCFGPISLFIIFQDAYIILYRLITKKEKYSILEDFWSK